MKTTNTDPIDEDEQEKFIIDTTKDFISQTKHTSNLLQKLCHGAAAATILSRILHTIPTNCNVHLCNCYIMYACVMHMTVGILISSSINTMEANNNLSPPPYRISKFELLSLIGVVVSLCQFPLLYYILDVKEIMVWMLLGTNLMTILAASYFIVDTQRTLASLNDLKSHKYKFKSL
jgi:hypothetical protein